MLAHASTNLRATVSLRSVAGTSYAADAAAKIAINNLRQGSAAPEWVTPGFNGTWSVSPGWWVYTNNSDGTGCFGASGLLPRTSLEMRKVYPRSSQSDNDTSARVECTPVPGTGILASSGGVEIDDPDGTDPFGQALTTVGTASDPSNGVHIDVLGAGNTNAAPIGGGVASKTYVNADHGDVTTDGFVHAASCGGSGRIVSPDKQCPYPGGIPTPTVPTSPLTAVPTIQDPSTVINCRFQPGYYNNGAALTAAVNACTGAAGPAYFASGKYYFDFVDNTPWTIDTKVIGGETTSSTTIPGACKSPIKFPTTLGVQFVFGGSSRILVDNNAQVELCGPADGGQPPLTIYQQQTGSAPAVTNVPATAAPTVTSTTGGKNDAFTVSSGAGTLAASVANADPVGATWTSSKKDNTGQLNLSGFPGLAAIPSNAAITAATVQVTYATGATPPASATPVVGVAGVGATSPIVAGNADVKAQLQSLLSGGGFNATNRPTIQIQVPGSAKNDTFTIDKVSLALTWESATLDPVTSTTFITTKANSPAKFVVQGAVYAPKGNIVMSPGNDANALVAFRWGLLAQGVDFKAQPMQLFGYPLVSIPRPGRGLGNTVTVVDLKVYACVQQDTCATGGTHSLTVRVMITDPPWADHPTEGKRKMQILSWAEQN